MVKNRKVASDRRIGIVDDIGKNFAEAEMKRDELGRIVGDSNPLAKYTGQLFKVTLLVVDAIQESQSLGVDGVELRPHPNRLVVNVQPDEGISLRFEGKVPGLGLHIQSAVLDFDYRQQFSAEPFEAYATLLLEAIRGNQSHYKDRHEIEAAWRIVMPVLDYWRDHPGEGLVTYPAGSWGPAAADELIKPHGPWRNPETIVSRTEPAAPPDFDLPP